jgi:phosphatidylinositol alpha-1,6-mannosyltransferase
MQMAYLVLTELFLPTKGGTAVWFDEVYRRLGGKEIHIVTARVPGAEKHDAQHPNTIHRLGLRRAWWLRPESLGIYAKFFCKAMVLTLGHRFDAIHAGRALPEGLVAWVVGRLTGRPVAVYAHGEELTGWGRGRKFQAMCIAIRNADWVIANSGFTRETLLSMGIAPERIVVIHPGVDTERFQPGLPVADLRARLGMAPGARLVLSVGRLQRRKGFDMVIRCLPALVAAGHDVHYAVVGTGDDRTYLESLARKTGVAERVHLLGHVPMDELPRWYNASDLFAMVNRDVQGDTEGFGLVFLEAAACGKASIAGKAGGTGSAVLDGATGLRVDGDDVAQVTQALLACLSAPLELERLSAAALARVRCELTWERVAERTREQLSRPVAET